MICPMFGDDCRFCSEETEVRMVRASDIHSHKLVVEQQRTPRGFFCNNHPISETGWIVDRNYCPARWGLRSGLDRIKEKPVKKVIKKKAVKRVPIKTVIKDVKKRPIVKTVVKKKPKPTKLKVKDVKKKPVVKRPRSKMETPQKHRPQKVPGARAPRTAKVTKGVKGQRTLEV